MAVLHYQLGRLFIDYRTVITCTVLALVPCYARELGEVLGPGRLYFSYPVALAFHPPRIEHGMLVGPSWPVHVTVAVGPPRDVQAVLTMKLQTCN